MNFKAIESDPDRMGGVICIKGHRIPVAQVFAEISEVATIIIAEFADNYDIDYGLVKQAVDEATWILRNIPIELKKENND